MTVFALFAIIIIDYWSLLPERTLDLR